jgi:hypothetical protein
MQQHKVSNLNQLIDAIGAGSSDPQEPGPIVVGIELQNGDKITGSYSQQTPDVIDQGAVIHDDEVLSPFVQRLLNDRQSFVTQTGDDDEVCTLIWEYSEVRR